MNMRTRFDQAHPMARARRVARSGTPRAVLPGALLGLFAAACGERYELGELEQTVDQVGADGSIDSIGILIVDGPEDVDVALASDTEIASWGDDRLGDVDGDGYDDWMTYTLQLVYGGPRVTDDTYPPPGAATTTFTFAPGAEASPTDEVTTRDMTALYPHPAGDVDGDGRADILFASRRMAFGPTVAPEYWPSQRAYLWYGRSERPKGEVRLQDEGVEFEPLHAVREAISGMESGVGDQTLSLTSVGDIDADGFDDLAYSYTFMSSVESPTTPETAQSATLIYYGSSQRLPTRGASGLEDARFSDIRFAGAMGDIDGDGSAEFWVEPFFGESSFVVSGSAQRISGESSVSALGLPFNAVLPSSTVHRMGDLDGDGIDDFIIDEAHTLSARSFLFYGSPSRASMTIERDLADAIFHFDGGSGDVMPLGDWNGDGFNDVMLQRRVRRGDEPIDASYEAVWRGEARVIPGTAQRYAGDYAAPLVRPELSVLEVGELGGPYGVYPIGDLDGDGFGDVQLTLAPYQTEIVVPRDFRSFIKYGGSLAAAIH
jgi:hypothetical protein